MGDADLTSIFECEIRRPLGQNTKCFDLLREQCLGRAILSRKTVLFPIRSLSSLFFPIHTLLDSCPRFSLVVPWNHGMVASRMLFHILPYQVQNFRGDKRKTWIQKSFVGPAINCCKHRASWFWLVHSLQQEARPSGELSGWNQGAWLATIRRSSADSIEG